MSRILYEDDPRAEAYEAAQKEVAAIRSELSTLRHRLRELGQIETFFDFDSKANEVAGALSLCISSLYGLVHGDASFARRAERTRELWADVEQHPENYLIKPGTGKDAHVLSVARERVRRAEAAEDRINKS